MSTTKKISMLFSAVAVTGLMCFGIPSNAKTADPVEKKQLQGCAVISEQGGIIKVGNTCTGTGTACIPNAC